MPGQVTGTIGQEDVRLENAATETTLALLLASTNKLLGASAGGKGAAKKIQDLYNKSLSEGNDLTKKNNKEVDTSTKSFSAASKGASNLAHAFGYAVGALDKMSSIASKGLEKLFSDVSPSVSDFTSLFKNLPGGELVSTFGGIIDTNIATFRELSSAGIDLGKGIYSAQRSAAQAGLPLEVFSKLIKENSTNLALLGGTASMGAQRFTDISANLKKNGVDLKLARLGFSMEEAATGVMSYLEIQTRNGRAQTMSTAQLSQGAEEYNLQLDRLARATGLQRAEIDKAVLAGSRDARLRLVTSNLDTKVQAKLSAQIKMLETADPSGALSNAFKDMLAGKGKALIGESGNLQQLGLQVSVDLANLVKQVNDGVPGAIDALMGAFGKIGEFATNQIGTGKGDLAALIMKDGKPNYLTLMASAVGLKDISTGLTVAAGEQTKAAKTTVNALAELPVALQHAKDQIMLTMIDSGVFDKFQQKLGDVIKALPGVATQLEGIPKWISENPITTAIVVGLTAIFATVSSLIVASIATKKLVGAITGGIGDGRSIGRGGLVTGSVDGVAASGKGIGAGLGSIGTGLSKLGAGAGTAITGILRGIAVGIRAFANPLVGAGAFIFVKVAAAIGAGIALISAGIAGASWLLGKALPTLVEGLEEFHKVDGVKLLIAAAGIGALSLAIAGFGAGSAIGSVGSAFSSLVDGISGKFGADSPIDKLNEFVMAATGISAAAVSLTQFSKSTSLVNKDFLTTTTLDRITIGAARFKILNTQLNATADAFKRLDTSKIKEISDRIAEVTGSLKGIGIDIAAKFESMFSEESKKSQEELLTDIGYKLDGLNSYMASLVDIQKGATRAIKKVETTAGGRVY